MTQEQAVRNHIINNGSITQSQAVRLYGRDLGQFLYDTEYVVLENYKPKENKKQC